MAYYPFNRLMWDVFAREAHLGTYASQILYGIWSRASLEFPHPSTDLIEWDRDMNIASCYRTFPADEAREYRVSISFGLGGSQQIAVDVATWAVTHTGHKWVSVWTENLTYEEYGKYERSIIKEIYDFLDLPDPLEGDAW